MTQPQAAEQLSIAGRTPNGNAFMGLDAEALVWGAHHGGNLAYGLTGNLHYLGGRRKMLGILDKAVRYGEAAPYIEPVLDTMANYEDPIQPFREEFQIVRDALRREVDARRGQDGRVTSLLIARCL